MQQWNRRKIVSLISAGLLVTLGLMVLALIGRHPAAAQSTAAHVAVPAQGGSGGLGWQLLGPGGGGQIQYLYPVPEVEGRVYWLSDMEGLFRSDDNGATWNFIGEDLTAGASYVVVTEPGNPNRVYVGTKAGVEISDDGGVHWQRADHVNAPEVGEFIGTLAVAPAPYTDTVFAAPCWHEDDNMFDWIGQGHRRSGQRIIYKSTDRGATWTRVPFTTTQGYRQVFSIAIDPTNPYTIYLGADAGVFKSIDMGNTWVKLDPPAGVAADRSRGIALSPDGKVLYATYAIEIDGGQSPTDSVKYVRRTAVYATFTDAINWVRVDDGLADPVIGGQNTDYWRPAVNPRSTATHHELIIGPLIGDNVGLHYGVFTVTTEITGTWTKIFENRPGQTPRVEPFERRGMNSAVQPKSRHYAWTPATWAAEKIWIGDQMSVFRGDAQHPNDWECISSPWVKNIPDNWSTPGYAPAFRNTGVNSTFSYDHGAYRNYVVQGVADLALLESWDYGETWTQRFFDMEHYYGLFSLDYWHQETHWNGTPVNWPGNWWYFNNVDSVLVVPTDPPIMLAGLGFFFGGGHHNMGMLMANKMEHLSPDDTWKYIGGTSWERVDWFYNNWWDAYWMWYYWPHNGLPDARISALAYNPANPKQVVVGTYAGLYMIDDIVTRVYSDTGNFYHIGTAEMLTHSFRYVAFDPNDPNVLYAMSAPYDPNAYGGWGQLLGEGRVWRGEHVISGTLSLWNWTEIYPRGGAGNTGEHDMSVWDHNGVTHIAVTMPKSGTEEAAVYLSTDGGENWTKVLGLAQALPLSPKDWYSPTIHNLSFSAIVGYEDQIFVALGDHAREKGYGLFRGVIRPDGNITWGNWAGEYGKPGYMYYPDARRMRVLETDGRMYLYVSTMGTGLWRRALEQYVYLPLVLR